MLADHEILEYAGFAPLRQGRIHVYCPRCGRKLSNADRAHYDPPEAVLMHMICERCAHGGWVEGPECYFDAAGTRLVLDWVGGKSIGRPFPMPKGT